MVANLNIELLGMAGKDKLLTRTVNTNLATSQNAGYYQKCKIDRASVSAVVKAAESARKIHKRLTRPWSDNGDRLLPATRIKEYTDEMRAGKQDFESAILDLEHRWPMVIAKQKQRLASSVKSIFVPGDYPYVYDDGNGGYTINPNIDLTKYYSFEWTLDPTPVEDNIIIELEAETIGELKANLKQREIDKLADSKLVLWKRIIEPVKNMADICSNDKKVFKSLIVNIVNEIEILHDLNITKDIDMTNMLKDIEAQLTTFTPGQIRNDKKLKDNLGKKATALSTTMDKYLGHQNSAII